MNGERKKRLGNFFLIILYVVNKIFLFNKYVMCYIYIKCFLLVVFVYCYWEGIVDEVYL